MALGVSRHGSQNVTADVEIGISGEGKYVYGIHIISGGTAGIVILRNGTSVSATAFIQETGTISTGRTISFGEGFFFPAGCFVDIDANVTSCLVSYDENKI